MPRRTARPQAFRTLTTMVARYQANDRLGLAAEVRAIARAVDMGEAVDVDMSAHGASTLVHMFAKIARDLPDQALELNAILAACRF